KAGSGCRTSFVVGIFLIAVVSSITHSSQLRKVTHQSGFHALLERDVRLTATLATTTETQHCYVVVSQALQRDVTAVLCQTWVDFVVQDVVDAINQGAVRTNLWHT